MKKQLLILFSFVVFIVAEVKAQPFVDIWGFNYQTFSSTYLDNPHWKNKTDNYCLNLLLPKEFKNGNTLLVRLNSEMINSTISSDTSYSSQLASISIPIGLKVVAKNKKWETIVLVVPKIASNFNDKINSHDAQYGGIFLQHFVPTNRLKIKAGLYYNHEAFGDFYVPLIGVDWKVSKRIYMYGILPTNYKVEFNILKNKLYTGLNLKYLTRSFRLSKTNNYDYVRYDESQMKIFVDYFVVPKILLFGEIGYTTGKNPLQYTYRTSMESTVNPIYTAVKMYPIVNIGITYRIRFDFEKD